MANGRLGVQRQMIIAALLVLAACSPVSVERVDQRTIYREQNRNALAQDELSEATRNVLRQHDQLDRFAVDPAGVIAALHAHVVAGRADDAELFALSETAYLYARQKSDRAYFLASAIYAYAFLFPDRGAPAPNPFDPRFRQACDFYNLALTSALRSGDNWELALTGGRYALPFGSLDIAIDQASLRWGSRQLNQFVSAAEIKVDGLKNIYRNPGLGAPLAVGTVPLQPTPGMMVAPKLRVPATALLRLPDVRAQLVRGQLQGTLTVYTIFETMQAEIDGRRVPLEYDQTAAFALGLAQSGTWSRELIGLLASDWLDIAPTLLVAMEPHQPGRIPVVFVHGTASSPGRWANMLNDLLDDPKIADNYEFWAFTYATGNPIPYSALLLREFLQKAIDGLGGATADPALRQMVVIGHSQGGLLAKMLAIDSGSQLWNAVSRRPLDDLRLKPSTRDQLRAALFVTPLPELHRVIFIATPQRGSFVAGFSVSRMLAQVIKLPLNLVEISGDLITGNEDALIMDPRVSGFGSIGGMAPGNGLIRALAAIPIAPSVRASSIIAVQGSGPIESGDDGVVEYASAHIDGVESELVVRSGHSAQENPAAIEEVRRILLLNLTEMGR